MPLTIKGKRALNLLVEKYGKVKGRRLFYSLEHKRPDWTKSWRQ